MKKIRAWLFPQWKVIKVFNREWIIKETGHMWEISYIRKHCCYEIMYSERRNEYKLVCHGYNAQFHPNYPEIVDYYRENYVFKES